jgi:transcriptional antiterminator RfaH
MSMLRWLLVHTKPCGEEIARSNLERQQYAVYFPRVLQTTRTSRQRRERIVALFPRYLFLRLDEGRQQLTPVHGTTGVSVVVRFGNKYAVVPDRVVEDLRARADPISGLHRLGHHRPLVPGMPVLLAGYPFDGLEAIFETQDGPDRSVVLLQLLGQQARARVSNDLLIPILPGGNARSSRDLPDAGIRSGH